MHRKHGKINGLRGRPISTGPRIATYHRVSTLDQDATLARTELDAWARRQGGRVVLRIEESRAGAGVVRPGHQKVLAAARAGTIDVVAVWKLDRWGRSVLDLLSNIRALTTAGVRFVAVSQGLDVRPQGDAVSDLLVNVLASVSEFERSLIRERTRLGVARARARGQKLGRPRLDHPSAADVSRLRRKGRSWTQIATELDCSVGVARLRAQEAA